jgi:GxxExxY protein
MKLRFLHEELTFSVIGAFFAVHRYLGFGLLEHHYMQAREIELRERGHQVGREVYVPVSYKGHDLGRLRLDMLVDEKLVVEGKAGFELHKSAKAQVYTYLKATHLEVGLLLHFGPEANFFRLDFRHSPPAQHLASRTQGSQDQDD